EAALVVGLDRPDAEVAAARREPLDLEAGVPDRRLGAAGADELLVAEHADEAPLPGRDVLPADPAGPEEARGGPVVGRRPGADEGRRGLERPERVDAPGAEHRVLAGRAAIVRVRLEQ